MIILKKILVGLSGGVDSAVSAYLLKNEFEVVGCNINFINKEFIVNEDAKKVADSLDIDLLSFNLYDEFKEKVIGNFIDSYKNGRTPNPCVLCNKYFKFDEMYKFAKENGCDYIATGHYAKVSYSEEYNRYVIKKSSSLKKDQTYFLYAINKDVIPYIVFPLEKYQTKDEIRQIASNICLPVAKKKDSLDVCFIDTDYKDYLLKNSDIKENIGDIVFKDGRVLGKHSGIFNYTIGQRKGLKISYEKPIYVIGFDILKNQVIVGLEEDLYKNEVILYDVNLLLFDDFNDGEMVTSKIRYQAKEVVSYLYHYDDTIKVVFETPQKSPTSGQSLVFYKGDILAGGGKIK